MARSVEALAGAVTTAFTTTADLDYWATVRHAEAVAPLVEEMAALVRMGQAQDAQVPLARAVELLLTTLDRGRRHLRCPGRSAQSAAGRPRRGMPAGAGGRPGRVAAEDPI